MESNFSRTMFALLNAWASHGRSPGAAGRATGKQLRAPAFDLDKSRAAPTPAAAGDVAYGGASGGGGAQGPPSFAVALAAYAAPGG